MLSAQHLGFSKRGAKDCVCAITPLDLVNNMSRATCCGTVQLEQNHELDPSGCGEPSSWGPGTTLRPACLLKVTAKAVVIFAKYLAKLARR